MISFSDMSGFGPIRRQRGFQTIIDKGADVANIQRQATKPNHDPFQLEPEKWNFKLLDLFFKLFQVKVNSAGYKRSVKTVWGSFLLNLQFLLHEIFFQCYVVIGCVQAFVAVSCRRGN